MESRPVLYLDLDDTILSWREGVPAAAPGAHDFIVWALAHLEVRWLTTWCPGGDMDQKLLRDLARMLDLDPLALADIRGFDWDSTGSKLNGLAWVEHLVLGRPFIWLEDDYGFTWRERGVLARHGMLENYLHCNVTERPEALREVHDRLRRWVEISTSPRVRLRAPAP
jgi:hypothetical protein